MKAKTYYKIIQKAPRNKRGLIEAVCNIVEGLNAEAEQIMKVRHVRKGKAVFAVVREQNDKWNAIVALHEKEFSNSPLQRNMYLNNWLKVMPELREYL